MAAVDFIQKAIDDLEAEQAKIARALGELRRTLATMRNGTPPSSQPQQDTNVFKRKYEEPARALIVQRLSERKALHVGQIKEALAAQGYEFLKQTIALNLKQLHQDRVVRRVKAPAGSGFTWAWLLEKERPSEEPQHVDE